MAKWNSIQSLRCVPFSSCRLGIRSRSRVVDMCTSDSSTEHAHGTQLVSNVGDAFWARGGGGLLPCVSVSVCLLVSVIIC